MFAHIDADAFFASVLQRQDPKLIGKPLLALGMGGGCVIAASYEAKAKGVRTGMRLTEARKLCPGATAISSNFTDAQRASEQIEMIIQHECPLIEKYSVDEWFLDLTSCVGGTPERLENWAQRIQCAVHKSVGLTVSIGIAPTKLLAKMASEYRKPAGTTIVHRKRDRKHFAREHLTIDAFLRNRPVEAIPGIGRAHSIHTKAFNLSTAYDFARADKGHIAQLFGKPGNELLEELSGTPVSGINTDPRPPKSISRARSFPKTNNVNHIFGILMQHVAYCILRMRTKGLSATMISVWLRDDTYKSKNHGRRLPQRLMNEEQLLPYIRACFEQVHDDGHCYTQIGLNLSGLVPIAPLQYSLFESPEEENSNEELQNALDTIRTRHGRGSITRGAGITIASKKIGEPDLYGNAAIVK